MQTGSKVRSFQDSHPLIPNWRYLFGGPHNKGHNTLGRSRPLRRILPATTFENTNFSFQIFRGSTGFPVRTQVWKLQAWDFGVQVVAGLRLQVWVFGFRAKEAALNRNLVPYMVGILAFRTLRAQDFRT